MFIELFPYLNLASIKSFNTIKSNRGSTETEHLKTFNKSLNESIRSDIFGDFISK